MTSTTHDIDGRDPYANDGTRNDMPATGRPGKRVYIETYGCQMNLADSELMGGILAQEGFDSAPSMEEADVILINTCAVREKAEERVFGRLSHLLPLKDDHPELLLGVTGCMANHLKDAIVERAPYVDLVIGPDAYRRLPAMIAEAQRTEDDPLVDVKLDRDESYTGLDVEREPGVNAWITVQRGCDKFCSFCVVPFTRGRERGVPMPEIVRQAQSCAEAGYREITLLGQTVNSYRWEEHDFADLLEELVEVDGIERLRFTSPYPTDFTPKLIETMAAHDKISKYIHLPAQSGSTRMLEAMRRRYTREEYDRLVKDIRTAIPDIAISTDIIVGYPGETEEDFQKTVELLETMRYDFAYLFKYSERNYTWASRNAPDDIPEEIKKQRLSQIIELQESICSEIFAGRVGATEEVLVVGESRRDDTDLCGRTDDFKMTVFPKPDDVEVEPGDIVRVEIDDATSHTLLGKFLEKTSAG
jgi:tRNA-2-methylthio-N6-dimethylallyladenosine synthase